MGVACVCACVCVHVCMSLCWLVISSSPADASTYAHFLFNAFDSAHTGSIKFEVCSHISPPLCLRSSIFIHHALFSSIRTLWQPCPSCWGAPLPRSYSGLSTFMTSTEMATSTKRWFWFSTVFGVFKSITVLLFCFKNKHRSVFHLFDRKWQTL